MPKFKISNTLDLIQTMKKMGVSDMFVGWKANLSGIANVKNLKVDYLRQSTVLKVDEKGVEATAATSLYSLGRSFYIKPANITFTVDQPFVCFIYDNKLRMPLFAALVKKPGVEE
ncbi:unnamed protein product [Heterobilharzia americana]|nr:unnamed protein product [Heterobilharzia americana]